MVVRTTTMASKYMVKAVSLNQLRNHAVANNF